MYILRKWLYFHDPTSKRLFNDSWDKGTEVALAVGKDWKLGFWKSPLVIYIHGISDFPEISFFFW